MYEDNFLSPSAAEAVADFESLLRSMNKEALDVDEFSELLRSFGFKGECSSIFLRLVGVLHSSSGNRRLTPDVLRELYSSPSYTACESTSKTGRELMDYVRALFDEMDSDGSGVLDEEEIEAFARALVQDEVNQFAYDQSPGEECDILSDSLSSLLEDVKQASDTESIRKAVKEILVRAGSDKVDLEKFASILLRYQPFQASAQIKVQGFDSSTLNPFHASAEKFVEAVENYVFQHDALNHHFLDTISKGVHGDETASIVATFLECYRSYTKNFDAYLSGCINKMPQEHMVEILLENEEEENGIYSQEDIDMMKELGLNPIPLKGVSHRDLFVQCIGNLKRVSGEDGEESEPMDSCFWASDLLKKLVGIVMPYDDPEPLIDNKDNVSKSADLQIAQEMVRAFNAACIDEATSTAESAIAAMYFGSELLVNNLYSQLSSFLQQDERLTRQDLAFFILHIDMDVEHALQMRKIILELVDTQVQRETMFKAVQRILDARVAFYEGFVQFMFPPTGHGGTQSSTLYNKQSGNWVRKKANCLSDFTGRPVVFEMCEEHLGGAMVLDVGCGEGYAARKFMSMGANAVVGIDVSENMVEKARQNATSSSETFLVGDASKLREVIGGNPAHVGIAPGRSLEIGCFDLAAGIFVFNYTSIHDMNLICQQVFDVLKPGGHFVFSVPHPFMLNAHREGDATFGFAKGDAKASSYFSLRDRKFSGTIKTLDGRVLNVKMCFKSISDYIDAVGGAGFDIVDLHEARVLQEHVAEHPKFFESVKDSPLHIVFKLRKPQVPFDPPSPLLTHSQNIRWSIHQYKNPHATLLRPIPPAAKASLQKVVTRLIADGFTAETYELSSSDKQQLQSVAEFALEMRSLVKTDTGAVIVQGLDFGTRQATKLAYYLLSSLMGRVDGSARGRLFEVKDNKISATNTDNVLFSVSNNGAPWHTDGASTHKSYECASLLCLQPAAIGGELRISNAVNALDILRSKLPKFLLYELFRPIPRDILENGNGKGNKEDILLPLSRCPSLLQRRVLHNSYPIFEQQHQESIRFRYMRHWIETGHEKAGIEMSPLLEVAMNLLDSALDESELWEAKMEAGEAIFCNNLQIAHARNAFENVAGEEPRHKVRVWLQL